MKDFNSEEIKKLTQKTPFFIFSKETVLDNLKQYKECLPPGTEICYAMKANSEEEVLRTLSDAGSSFEVSSKYELELLQKINVPADRILYGTSVKPADHIVEFVKYGVDRFAFDSQQELEKIALHAPGSRVYVRVLVDDHSNSVFTMSEKFGAPKKEGVTLLKKAKELELIPYGISFNVGSQARNKNAWKRGVEDISSIMKDLLKEGIKIEVINLGGGFPHSYIQGDGFPSIQEISESIAVSLKKLPYQVSYIAEPGRGLVANAYCLVATVIATNRRKNGHWIYLDAGVYNALLEATKIQGSTQYKIELLSSTNETGTEKYILTGPTGDNLDVIGHNVSLPKGIQVGDKIVVYDVGAYSFTLMTPFNGFPKPETIK